MWYKFNFAKTCAIIVCGIICGFFIVFFFSGFCDLIIEDQISLLKSSFVEVGALRVAFRLVIY